MEKLANALTDRLYLKKDMPEELRSVYAYGFKLMLSDVTNAAVVLLLGLIFGRLAESLIFVSVLCGVRIYSGGFHAKTFHICRCSMILTYFITLAVSQLLVWCEPYLGGALMLFLSALGMINVCTMVLFAPVIHPNKPLSKEQKETNKAKAVLLTSALSALSILCTFLGIKEGIAIAVTLTAVSVLMPIGRKSLKGGS